MFCVALPEPTLPRSQQEGLAGFEYVWRRVFARAAQNPPPPLPTVSQKMQRDSSSTHKCSSAWKSYLPQDNEIWKQISTGAPASHPLRLIQASKRRRRRNPKPRTPKTSTYGNIVYTYFPLDLYTLDAWRIDERWMKILSALVSRSSLWSALALRKPNEREHRFCEKSRA